MTKLSIKKVLYRVLPVLFLILFAGGGQVLIKKGVMGLNLDDFVFAPGEFVALAVNILQNIWLVLGNVSLGIAFLIYISMLSRVQLNMAYPMLVSGSIIFISIASRFLFQEVLSLFQLSGILLIIFGIFLMFFKKPASGQRILKDS